MSIIYQVLHAILDSLIAWLERAQAKPDTIEDAKTDDDLLRRWRAWLDERLHDDAGDSAPRQ